jgi:hypothetical protein
VKRLLEDMEAILGDDITGLEGEDRDDVTFESWLAEMIDWGRYWRVDEATSNAEQRARQASAC